MFCFWMYDACRFCNESEVKNTYNKKYSALDGVETSDLRHTDTR